MWVIDFAGRKGNGDAAASNRAERVGRRPDKCKPARCGNLWRGTHLAGPAQQYAGALVAQWIEQRPYEALNPGSTPGEGTFIYTHGYIPCQYAFALKHAARFHPLKDIL